MILASLIVLGLSAPAYAERTDVVILRNGDHITGEVKKLDYGKLEYKTDDMDNVYIEWEKIHHITSVNWFEIIDTYGIRRWGSIGRTDTPEEFVALTSAGPDTLRIKNIVRLIRIKDSFWARLKGSISIGFSYTRATKTAEGSLGGDTRYRGERYAGRLSYSAYVTDQSEKRTSRYNFGFNADRFLARRWTVGGAFGIEHNEELGLDRRASLTATGSRFALETNKTVIRVALGLSGTRETYIGSDSSSYNLELPIEVTYSRFTFHNPESSIQISAAAYPNLTTKGRYRGSLTTELNHEIYKDLFFVISFYYDYDNKPPENAAKDDYRISTSLRWTFG